MSEPAVKLASEGQAAGAPLESKAIATSRELRRRRARRLAIGGGVWVGLPTLIAAVYYGLVATPQYESIAVIAVESSERSTTSKEGLESFLPHAGSNRDLQVARDYVGSRAMLELLLAHNDFIGHYGADAVDRWSRVSGDASRDVLYAYFKDKVQVTADQSAGTLTVRVRAFSGDKAQEIGQAVVAGTEQMMNELTARAWQDQLAVGQAGVDAARQRLRAAQAALTAAGPTPGDDLVVERDLARTALASAAAAQETVRTALAHDRRYLISVAPPSLPDAAAYPRRMWSIATVFVIALALAGVASLLFAAVREHARF